MNLLADYIQPLTIWLQANPHWSLFITFIISLSESLAVVGSIVPGSVTMTAIGILAGSGIMRVDLTLLAATLGAICGDSISYALGYYYSEQLVEMWPFRKYPNLLKYGKDFFTRHGGKSVLIGRFVGPLRSIIPVIAGIMHMSQWRFLLANALSGIGWSFLYVMPGVLIGAAGHELSTEAATRLFILILAVLASIWLTTFLVKLLCVKINYFLKKHMLSYWSHAKRHSKLLMAITPSEEENHYPTVGLFLLTLFSVLGLICMIVITKQTQWFNYINFPIHLFNQSLHTLLLESVFILCTQTTSTLTLVSLFSLCFFWFLYQRNIKIMVYISSLLLTSGAIALLLSHNVYIPRPQGLLVTMPGSSFLAINLVIATAFYGFLSLYINSKYSLLTNTFSTFVLVLLGLSGFASIYLGDYWFTDVITSYLLGISVFLCHWIIYRKFNYALFKNIKSFTIIFSFMIATLVATLLSTYFNFKSLAHAHQPYHKEFILKHNVWWNQLTPKLPLYRMNRVGNRISLLNIQYDGDLYLLQSNLEHYGWKVHTESFWAKLLMRMNSSPNEVILPLLTQLYENKHPELTMTYKEKESNLVLQLTIWESNYNLNELNNPLWIGSLHQNTKDSTISSTTLFNPISYLIPALNRYTLRRIEIPASMITTTPYPMTPYILLIKEPGIGN